MYCILTKERSRLVANHARDLNAVEAQKIIYIISVDSTPILNSLSFPGFVNQTLFKKERDSSILDPNYR
jgi:hypothetical protein